MKKAKKTVKKNVKFNFKFPKDFMWGTSSSAHQVEGKNIYNDWYTWEREGKILNQQVSGDACNHYNLYRQDFDLMKSMNHNTHRLSIEWSRIEQTEGHFNNYEIEHYRRVLEDLKKKGIRPMVTLFHFTLPQWFTKKGGFLHKDARKIFNRYVEKITEELGDLVEYWVTINEPYVYASFGYWERSWPPGEHSILKSLKVLKKLLYVHIDSYRTIKMVYEREGFGKAQVGFAKSFVWYDPYTKHSLASKLVAWFYRYFYNKVYFKPFCTGRMPFIFGLKSIPEAKKNIDFIGMNYYFKCTCRFSLFRLSQGQMQKQTEPTEERTLFNWEVYPKGLYNLLKLIHRKLKKPIIITENGISTLDDGQRISYILRHLRVIHQAIDEGVDVRGYLYWSLIDNFEWAEGYTQPFGLMAMKHKTFERIPKASASFYADICGYGGVTEDIVEKYAKDIGNNILN